jgi:hypothetical protein
MNRRKLIDGTKVEETEFPIELRIMTHCPEKWKLIDLETGEEYIGVLPSQRIKNQHWKKIKNGY